MFVEIDQLESNLEFFKLYDFEVVTVRFHIFIRFVVDGNPYHDQGHEKYQTYNNQIIIHDSLDTEY